MKQPARRHKHNIMANRMCIFLLCICAMIACNKDESSAASPKATASVSIYAVVPDAPQMNFFLNGNNIAASVPFGSFTLYDHVAPGTVALKAQTLSSDSVTDTSFDVSANQYYSFFLTNSFAKIKSVLIKDSFNAPDSGYTSLRFFVLSPGAPNIDFHAVKDNVNNYTWKNRSFGDGLAGDSINTFIKLKEGTYSFYAVNANNKDTLARFTNRTFKDSSNYTIMLEGFYNETTNDTTLLLGTRLHQ